MRAAIVVAIAVFAASCSEPPKASPREPVQATQADVDALEPVVLAACRCEGAVVDRDGGKEERRACWNEFEARVSRFARGYSMATACGPESVETYCFDSDGRELCLITHRGAAGVCTAEEAAAFVKEVNARSGGC